MAQPVGNANSASSDLRLKMSILAPKMASIYRLIKRLIGQGCYLLWLSAVLTSLDVMSTIWIIFS